MLPVLVILLLVGHGVILYYVSSHVTLSAAVLSGAIRSSAYSGPSSPTCLITSKMAALGAQAVIERDVSVPPAPWALLSLPDNCPDRSGLGFRSVPGWGCHLTTAASVGMKRLDLQATW